jgi:gluconate 5-dehydrogenase
VSFAASALFSLEGKTAVLTGASGFLGNSFAEALLANGACLIALGRSDKLEANAQRWRETHGAGRVRTYQVDMYNIPALERVLDQISASGPVDILVNNAHELGPATGFNTPDGSLENASLDQWMRNLTGGVYWPALTAQKLGPGMKSQGRGSIINIATMYALAAPRPQLYEGTEFLNPPGYSASKAALVGLTRYIASFWGKYGIRANAIAPGPFSNTQSDGPNSVASDSPFLAKLRASTCLGRIGRPAELAGALVFLASDASSFVTGHTLVVDGGWTAV